jgi:hypothetical protein
MKPSSIITTAAILLLSLPAAARLDETPAQCNQRYGTPVSEVPGNNGVAGVRIYNKAGMEIIVVFIGPSTNDALAGMLIYNSNPNVTIRRGTMTPDVETPLLATVPGRWEPYTPPPALRTGAASKPMTPLPSILEKRRDECNAVVKAMVTELYPLGSILENPSNLYHMETYRFAVRVPSGLAIASYSAVPIIQKWHNTVQRQNAEAARPPPKNLSGF